MDDMWNYAVVRTLLGDLWVGKTKLKADGKTVYADYQLALDKALNLFKDAYPDFDSDMDEDDDDFDYDVNDKYLTIRDQLKEDVDEIKSGMEKFVV